MPQNSDINFVYGIVILIFPTFLCPSFLSCLFANSLYCFLYRPMFSCLNHFTYRLNTVCSGAFVSLSRFTAASTSSYKIHIHVSCSPSSFGGGAFFSISITRSVFFSFSSYRPNSLQYSAHLLFISFFSCCYFSSLSFTAARLGIHVRFFCPINLYAALHLGLLSLMFVSISLHLH